MFSGWLEFIINGIADRFPEGFWLHDAFNVRALIVILLVSAICGAVGSLVVGNRMSFFSDALAHSAFAGVALGMLISLLTGRPDLEGWLLPAVMVMFGIVVGIAIAYIREHTGLTSDTVIGVFFAFSVGFGGMLLAPLQNRRTFSPDEFLFGSPLFVHERDMLAILGLGVLLIWVLFRRYNHFVLTSFNSSLARSRRVPLRWCNYLFIILLALIVNLCLRAVGALLINAMLVVPAATAANVSRNLRQMFWSSICLSILAGVSGLWFSNSVRIPIGRGAPIEFGPAGSIVVLSVLVFFVTVAWKLRQDRPGADSLSPSLAGPPLPRDNSSQPESISDPSADRAN